MNEGFASRVSLQYGVACSMCGNSGVCMISRYPGENDIR